MSDSSFAQDIGRLEGKVDMLISMQTQHNTQSTALAVRVTALEKSKAWLLGAAATAGAVISFAVSYLTKGTN